MISGGFAFIYLKYRFGKSSNYQQTHIKVLAENKGIWGNSKDQRIVEKKRKFKLLNTI